MAFGSTPVTTGQGSLATNQLPISTVAVPNAASGNLTALQGGPAAAADTNGNVLAPVAIYLYDGNDVTQGTTTDAANANTIIGQLKQIKANTGSVTIGAALPAGTNVIGHVIVDSAGSVSITSLPALPSGTNVIGHVIVDSASSVSVTTLPGVGTDGSAIPSMSMLMGASDGTLLQQLLVESASNRNLRIGIYSGANEATVTGANALKVDNSAVTQPVSGVFWQATQPVSGTVSITANSGVNVAQFAGTATDTNSGVKSAGTQRVVLATDQPQLTNALKVDGSAITQPVSAAALPLPTGASTAAKQPALGTAGTASSDVLSVQGIASMTPLKTDGSGVTQPVNGTVTANIGTAGTLALETGGNLAGAKSDLDTLKTLHSDTFSSATTLSAATTFSGVATISQLVANSYVTLTNSGNQASFLVAISATAFNGTINFYGLDPDAASLQPINAHMRNSTTIANNIAINVSSATLQTWQGGSSGFKAVYAVCTAFTSGSASVQIGLSAAPYALEVLNTVSNNITQVNGAAHSSGNPLFAQITNGNANGQALMSNSAPVVIASDQSKLPTKAASGDFVAGSITDIATLLTLSGTPTDANTINSLMGRLTKIRDLLTATLTISGAVTTSGTVTEANSASIKTDLDTLVTNTADLLVDGDNLATINTNTANIPVKGQSTMSASTPVTFASDQTPLVSSTATRTNVVAAASDTSLLASNASRKGAIFYNDSTAILYLAYGAGAASTTSYSVQIPAQGYFELLPAPIYIGAIRGIWSAANGSVRITEMS